MFNSFKNVPVVVTSEEFCPSRTSNPFYGKDYVGYSFAAESININSNPSTNFYFRQKDPMTTNWHDYPYKKNSNATNTQGIATSIDISYYMSVPEDSLFFLAMSPSFRAEKDYACNDITNQYITHKDYSYNVLKKYNLIFGSGIYDNCYLQSYSFEVIPNNVIKSNATFISYYPFSGFDENVIDYLKKSRGQGNLYDLDVTNNTSRNWCPAENFNLRLYQKNTINQNESCILDSSSGNLLRYNYSYKAELQPIYKLTDRYPYRVIYNKEEISMDLDIDYQYPSFYDPLSYVYKTKLKIGNLSNQILEAKIGTKNQYGSCGLSIESGTLINKQIYIKSNEITNNRFSLRYYI